MISSVILVLILVIVFIIRGILLLSFARLGLLVKRIEGGNVALSLIEEFVQFDERGLFEFIINDAFVSEHLATLVKHLLELINVLRQREDCDNAVLRKVTIQLASVNKLKRTEQWTSGFDPAPLTFINQRRWEDESGEAPVGRRVI